MKCKVCEAINCISFAGDVTKGEVGFAAIPGKEKEFRESVDVTVKLAIELETSK